MSNIKRHLDKVFQIYYQCGITNRLIVIRDVTCLLFLKSLEDYPDSYLDYMHFDHALFGMHENYKWSSVWNMNQDDAKELFLNEILPFLQNNFKDFFYGNLNLADGIGRLTTNEFSMVIGKISDMFIYELDGNPINETNISIYDDIYETLLEYLPNAPKSCAYAPKHLRRLLCELIQIKSTDKVYDTNMGCGSLLMEAYKSMVVSNLPPYRMDVDDDGLRCARKYSENLETDYFRQTLALEGNEKDGTLKWLCLMNFYFHRIGLMQSQFNDFIKFNNLRDDMYDKMLCIHPQNGYYENFTTVQKHLKQGGKAAFVLPQLFLYGDTHKIRRIRKTLLTQYVVEAVITLPEYEFYPFMHLASAIIIFSLPEPNNIEESKVWLCNLNNDGYSNDRKRSKTSDNPLPILLDAFQNLSELDTEWFECKNIPLQDILGNDNSLYVDEYIDNAKEPEEDVDPFEIIENLVLLGDKLKAGIKELKDCI